jgi:hypothetical protein
MTALSFLGMRDTLTSDQYLTEPLVSENGRYLLVYQGDGNLVLYRIAENPWRPLWASNTAGTSIGMAVMQGDGNFVIYDARGEPVWSSGTPDAPGARLVLQNDGNLVLYDSEQIPRWNTETAEAEQRPQPEPQPSPPTPQPQPVGPRPSGTGGIRGQSADSLVRPRLQNVEMRRFVSWRGRFQFPPPWNTEGIRVTNSEDSQGQDGVQPTGYSYWRTINAHAGQTTLLVLVGIDRRSGGEGPTIFEVSKQTGAVEHAWPLFDSDNPLSWDLAEKWYWSAQRPLMLYVVRDTHLLRLNVRTGETEIAGTAPDGCYFDQCHSSHDDQTHSATVRDRETYRVREAIAWREGGQTWSVPINPDDYDECQITADGQYLMVKGWSGANRYIELASERAWMFPYGQAALGHSDVGYGYVIGEDANTEGVPAGAFRLIRLDRHQPIDGGLQYHMHGWEPAMTRHVSHTNARPGPPDEQLVLMSSASQDDRPRANELVLVRLNGSQEYLSVAPNLTSLSAPGGNLGNDPMNNRYRKHPKANLDPYGEYACFSGNLASDRMDIFLVRLPAW